MTLSLDAIVSHLVSLGFSKEVAEAEAREQLGLAPQSLLTADRDERVLEKEEQSEIVKIFRKHGFVVRSTSQSRPSKIAIGFPDLFCTHKRLPIAFFFESKRQVGGVVSEAQREFGDDCWRCGVRWYSGDRYEARRLLASHNIPEIL